MAVKVTMKLDGFKKVAAQLASNKAKTIVANAAIKEIKTFIARGISPVHGEGRFDAYKDPKKYPADKKSNRPVNMHLTGEMLAALEYRLRGGRPAAFLIGWFSGLQKKKAHNHNTGDTVPKRRLLPTEKNEQFNVSITRLIKNTYAKILSDILKK